MASVSQNLRVPSCVDGASMKLAVKGTVAATWISTCDAGPVPAELPAAAVNLCVLGYDRLCCSVLQVMAGLLPRALRGRGRVVAICVGGDLVLADGLVHPAVRQWRLPGQPDAVPPGDLLACEFTHGGRHAAGERGDEAGSLTCDHLFSAAVA